MNSHGLSEKVEARPGHLRCEARQAWKSRRVAYRYGLDILAGPVGDGEFGLVEARLKAGKVGNGELSSGPVGYGAKRHGCGRHGEAD